MNKISSPLLAAAPFAALITLAACGEAEPEVVGGLDEADSEEIEELDPAEMPAMVRGSQSYRCGNGSVVYVTYYTNDTQAGVSSEQDGVPTILMNEAMAEPAEGEEADAEASAETDGPIRFSGEGQTLVGTGDSVTYNGQSCNS